jgi:hypothetical protein
MIYVFAGNRIIIVSGEFLPNDLTISCKVCGKRKIAIWNQRGAVNFDLVLGENVCGICIAKEKWAHSPNFPSCLKNKRKEEDEMMKNLKQLLLAVIFVVAVSMTAAAQKEGDKNRLRKRVNRRLLS